jgi:hypothetical protein
MKVSRVARVVVLAGAIVLVVTGCNALVPRTSLPPLLPGAVRIATDDSDPGAGVTGMCRASRALDPVVGRLEGDAAGTPFSTWLVAADGRLVYVKWPRGFTARFEPSLELIDSRNEVIARRGEIIDLNMNWNVAPELGNGASSSPYRPIWVNDGCYAPVH